MVLMYPRLGEGRWSHGAAGNAWSFEGTPLRFFCIWR